MSMDRGYTVGGTERDGEVTLFAEWRRFVVGRSHLPRALPVRVYSFTNFTSQARFNELFTPSKAERSRGRAVCW